MNELIKEKETVEFSDETKKLLRLIYIMKKELPWRAECSKPNQLMTWIVQHITGESWHSLGSMQTFWRLSAPENFDWKVLENCIRKIRGTSPELSELAKRRLKTVLGFVQECQGMEAKS